MRADGHGVEPICEVLRQQGLAVAPRSYRAWKTLPACARYRSDAAVLDKLRHVRVGGPKGRPLPEVLYGRRKMTAWLARNGFPGISKHTVDRLMRDEGMNGLVRGRHTRTTIPAKTGAIRATDLLNRCFSSPRPNHAWVTDFTYSAQLRIMCSPVGRPSLGMAIASGATAHNHRSCRKARSRSPGWNRVGSGLGSSRCRRTASLAARSASRY